MYEFLTASPNLPFAVALGLLIVLLIIELAGFLLGTGLSSIIGDGLTPDAGVDIDIPAGDGLNIGLVSSFLYWLNIGRVPLIVLAVIFMAFFVIIGYALQYAMAAGLGHMLPAWIAAPAAFVAAMPLVRSSGCHIAKIVPRDETEAVSMRELVGLRAVVTLGTAKKGYPAQARATDKFSTAHYVMVEPDDPAQSFGQGAELLLVRFDGTKFFAIHHPDGA